MVGNGTGTREDQKILYIIKIFNLYFNVHQKAQINEFS